jgi:hypothetical protein
LEEDVAMVFHSSNGMHKDFVFLADRGDVRPQAALYVFGYGLAAIFCAEDQMNVVLSVAMRQWIFLGAAFYLLPRRWRSIFILSIPSAYALVP